MAHPLHHAESSARKFGGVPDDYQFVHDWFDSSKEHLALFVHRAYRHHTAGIYDAQRIFGLSLTNSAGRVVPIRWIGEQHVREDCQGRIPSLADWLGRIQPEPRRRLIRRAATSPTNSSQPDRPASARIGLAGRLRFKKG